MKKTVIIFVFIAFWQVSFAADSTDVAIEGVQVQYDDAKVAVRDFDEEKITEYKNDSNYNYGRAVVNLNLWNRIKRWLSDILQNLFGGIGAHGRLLLTYLFYTLAAVILVYAILKLLGVDIKNVIYGTSDKGNIAFDLVDENIHEMDFEKLIEEAIEKKEFRKAVRLFYLFSLKKLSDKHLITWQPGKTNHEYIAELQAVNVKPSFDNLSYYFEYLWYGDFEINQNIFSKAKLVFEELKAKVEEHKG